MIASVRPRSCLLVWASLLVCPTLLLGFIIAFWWGNLSSLQTRAQDKERQLQRLQSVGTSITALESALQQERSRDDLRQYYFEGETWSLAAASAQNTLQSLMTEVGMSVSSIQTRPAERGDPPPRVSLLAQGQCTTGELGNLVYRIESAKPFLFIDEITVRGHPRANANIPGVVNEFAAELVIQLKVSGAVALRNG